MSEDPEIRTRFGLLLGRRRRRRRLTQTELAERIQVSVKNLNNIEYGRNYPSLPVYHRMCVVLGLKAPPFFL